MKLSTFSLVLMAALSPALADAAPPPDMMIPPAPPPVSTPQAPSATLAPVPVLVPPATVGAASAPASPTNSAVATAPISSTASLAAKSPAAPAPAKPPRRAPKASSATGTSINTPPPPPASTPSVSRSDLAAEQYFTNPNPALSEREQAAIAIGRKWQDGSYGSSAAAMPVAGNGGAVRFAFGVTQPSIVCAVLQVCDVELQPGEQVNSLQIGDQERWSVEPAISGSGAGEVQHLIIKPQDVGLETSLVVTTTRRTYHMRLRSHRTDFMPRVAFSYPEDAMAKWEALRNREVKERRDATIPGTGEYLGDLSFDYTLSGSASWKPVRVYNDGRKTILQMPAAMSQTEAPTLLIVRKDGGFFSDDETVMVNYRVQGNRYIVDSIFDKAILIAGVGSTQDRVTIQRGK